MSDPCLLAILFVSSSSKGSHLAFRWPARPKAVRRLARPLPIANHVDYAWRAAHPYSYSENNNNGNNNNNNNNETDDQHRPFSLGLALKDTASNSGKERVESVKGVDTETMEGDTPVHTPAYEWRLQDWSDRLASYTDQTQQQISHHHHHSNPRRQGRGSRKNTNAGFSDYNNDHRDSNFEWVLGYRTKILAEHIFRFDRNLCNQRFELILEELLFLGHPVCIGEDGTWMWDQLYKDRNEPSNDKGQDNNDDEDSNAMNAQREQAAAAAAVVSSSTTNVKDPTKEASLKSFHFILVLDRPDPALGGHVNLMRFVDVYYEQIAVKMTAALHFEQSRDGYVEKETDLLVDLMDVSDSYADFEKKALEKSSLARAMRDIFEAVQSQRLAHVTVGAFELDLQMPWYHAELLSGEADPEGAGEYENEQDERWDPGFGKGWRVKRLVPWNTLLFLDGWEAVAEIEPESEEMTKFREVLTPDISFSDAAELLDWELESEVMRMARYMIYLKKAKVCDVIHPKLLNIYVIPARIMTPLSDLSKRFQDAFPPTTPALETILAAVSSSPQAFFHFVPSHDHYDLYHQILIWLLKNDALIMLHVRFRLVATPKIKEAVWKDWIARRKGITPEERGRKRKPSGLRGRENSVQDGSVENSTHVDSPAQEEERQSSPTRANDAIPDEPRFHGIEVPEIFDESFINDPGKAHGLEQLWIDEIARQRPEWEKKFLQVCEFFDGRTTFDEIQYRSQLKRSQFRQIVAEYDPWLLSLLHP